MTGRTVAPVITTLTNFEEAAEYAFTGKGMLNASDLDKVDTSAKRLAEEMHHAEDVSVVSLVDNILETALKRRASDIHFEPQLYEMVVRIRIDGVMHPLTQIPNDTKGGVVSRIKIMGDMNLSLIHISEPTRRTPISYAVFCLKKKKKKKKKKERHKKKKKKKKKKKREKKKK